MDGYNFLHYTVCEGRLADVQNLEQMNSESYYAVLQAFYRKIKEQFDQTN